MHACQLTLQNIISDTLASENLLTHGKCGAKSVETQVSRSVMTVAEVTDAATSVSTDGRNDADTRGKK